MSTTSAGTAGPSSIMEGKIPVFVFPVQLGRTPFTTETIFQILFLRADTGTGIKKKKKL
jgi:hypothetical protein